jgi:hypothetical protein
MIDKINNCSSNFFDKYNAEKLNEHYRIMKGYGEKALKNYKQSGVVSKKYWIASNDSCEVCQRNSNVGSIPLNSKFPSGHLFPPAGKTCRCSLGGITDSD